MCETRKALPDTGQSTRENNLGDRGRTGVEYPDRESARTEVADAASYSEGEKDLYMGKVCTEGRSPQRKLLPDTQDRRTGANLTAGDSKSGDFP